MSQVNRQRAVFFIVAVFGLGLGVQAYAAPRVVSINLCTDQLLLALAEPEQILSVSWLAADPEESMLAAEASRYPINYGSAEEVLAFDPDVVLAGSYTSPFTRQLLARLGYSVHDIAPAESLGDIERNIRQVARAIDREARGELVIEAFRARERGLVTPSEPLRVAVVRPGGFTVEPQSLANELIERAGVRNVAIEEGLDRWGSLPLETLVRAAPDVIVISRYEADAPSLANGILEHPALRGAARSGEAVQVPTRYWACGLPQSLESVELLLAGIAARERRPVRDRR